MPGFDPYLKKKKVQMEPLRFECTTIMCNIKTIKTMNEDSCKYGDRGKLNIEWNLQVSYFNLI